MVLDSTPIPIHMGEALVGRALPDAYRDVLLGHRQRLRSTLQDLGSGPVGRMIDDKFQRFGPTAAADRIRQSLIPSKVVFSHISPVVRWSDLGMYEEALAIARRHSRALRRLDDDLAGRDRWIMGYMKRHPRLYRGIDLAEFETVVRLRGAFGFHNRLGYAARTDFASFTIDAGIATVFAVKRTPPGLVVEVDVSDVDLSGYEAAGYQARNSVRVTRGGRGIFNPYEGFGGSVSGLLVREAEIRARAGSRPPVRSVGALGSASSKFKSRLARAVAILEGIQGSKITIKYVGDRP
ncbi:MAG: hypothetical protein MPJ07_04715 [Nitrosopumilus sp.]|nr:hypothetical protein [Nitrosopumilus sp.]